MREAIQNVSRQKYGRDVAQVDAWIRQASDLQGTPDVFSGATNYRRGNGPSVDPFERPKRIDQTARFASGQGDDESPNTNDGVGDYASSVAKQEDAADTPDPFTELLRSVELEDDATMTAASDSEHQS